MKSSLPGTAFSPGWSGPRRAEMRGKKHPPPQKLRRGVLQLVKEGFAFFDKRDDTSLPAFLRFAGLRRHIFNVGRSGYAARRARPKPPLRKGRWADAAGGGSEGSTEWLTIRRFALPRPPRGKWAACVLLASPAAGPVQRAAAGKGRRTKRLSSDVNPPVSHAADSPLCTRGPVKNTGI